MSSETTAAAVDGRDEVAETVRAAALELHGLEKSYGSNRVVKRVDLTVLAGEVHALVGENGAGKSTLVGLSCGSVKADAGSVAIAGTEIASPNPRATLAAGLAIVHQEPALLPDLTVAENMLLRMPAALRPSIGASRAWADEALAQWRDIAEVSAATFARHLPPDQRFVVELARALAAQPKVLVLDEPTEHLAANGVAHLFATMRSLVDSGIAIVYISHRIAEVKQMADRISVLRDGVMIATAGAESLSEDDIVNLIVGRQLEGRFPAKSPPLAADAPVVLDVEGLTGARFGPVDLQVRAGEIIGLAGIEGQGQRGFLRALGGIEPVTGGVLRRDGMDLPVGAVRRAVRRGTYYVSHDRHREGLLHGLGVRENASSAALGLFSRYGLVSSKRERTSYGRLANRFSIKAASSEIGIDTLSGGNQQKVMLARGMARDLSVLLADEPTVGVDVGARTEIYGVMREVAEGGAGVVVLSSDAAELAALCDRVLVFSRGQVVRELTGENVAERAITEAALTTTASREEVGAVAAGDGSRQWRIWLGDTNLLPVGILVVLIAALAGVVSANNSYFLTSRSLGLLLPLFAVLALLAIGQQFALMVGAVDLSVGPMASVVVVLATFVLDPGRSGTALVVGFVLVVAAAVVVGAVNWTLASLVRINPLVATLVTYTGLQGIALLLRPTPSGAVHPALVTGLQAKVGFLPVFAIVVVVLAAVFEYALTHTLVGIALRAAGSNAVTAAKVGVRVRVLALVAFVLCSVLAAFAGLLLAARTGVGDPAAGNSYTLTCVAAVAIGGASIMGGRGSFVAAALGALLLVEISSAVQFLNLSPQWQAYLSAGLTLAAVAFYSHFRNPAGRRTA